MSNPTWLKEGHVIRVNGIPETPHESFSSRSDVCVRVRTILREGEHYDFVAEVVETAKGGPQVGSAYGFFIDNFVELVNRSGLFASPRCHPAGTVLDPYDAVTFPDKEKVAAETTLDEIGADRCMHWARELIGGIQLPDYLNGQVKSSLDTAIIAVGGDATGVEREVARLKDEEEKRIRRTHRAWPLCVAGGTIEFQWSDTRLFYKCSKCT